MAKKHFYLVGIFATTLYILYFAINIYLTPKLPELDLTEWWGRDEEIGFNDTSIRPFKISFSDEMIKDLKYRLKNHRPFPSLNGTAFQYGFNSDVLASFIEYWSEKYDFKERLKVLNKYAQYKTKIQGLDMHFIWVKPTVPANTTVIPLLLLNGWPSSIVEYMEVIPLLTAVEKNRDFAIEVVVPSLPGYGFSDATTKPGLGADKVAVVFRNLMHRLGHTKYVVQGGDWGTLIGRHMATFFPEELLGYHSNFPYIITPSAVVWEFIASFYPPLFMNSKRAEALYPMLDKLTWIFEELGYVNVLSNKPDTTGVALQDSPAGLLVTILQKFSMATNKGYRHLSDGGLEHFNRDQLLDNVMVYWATNTITSSMRLYAESFCKRHAKLGLERIPSKVPTWAMLTKNEVRTHPEFILKFKHPNLLHTTEVDEGGHFPALEMPKLFAKDVIQAIDAFKRWHKYEGKTEL